MSQLESMRRRWTGQCLVLLFTPGRYCEYYAACETRSGGAHPQSWKPHVGSEYNTKTVLINATGVAFGVCCRVVANGPMLDPLKEKGEPDNGYPDFLKFVSTEEYCDMWRSVGASVMDYEAAVSTGFFE